MALELVNKLPYDHPYRWDGTLFGGPKLWRPDELGASLALWLDAEDMDSITLNGSTVSQWNDKSVNAYHLTQPTAANQPLYDATLLNGKPALNFNLNRGLRRLVESGSIKSIVTVIKSDTTFWRTYHAMLTGTTIATRLVITRQNDTGLHSPFPQEVWRNGESKIISTTGTFAPTEETAIAAFILKPLQGDLVLPGIAIGNLEGGGGGGSAIQGEVIASTVYLSTEDRQRLEGYLAWKWGLAANLPADHPYKSSAPTV